MTLHARHVAQLSTKYNADSVLEITSRIDPRLMRPLTSRSTIPKVKRAILFRTAHLHAIRTGNQARLCNEHAWISKRTYQLRQLCCDMHHYHFRARVSSEQIPSSFCGYPWDHMAYLAHGYARDAIMKRATVYNMGV